VTPVPPQELALHWPRVESGLLEIVAKAREKWTPIHVLNALHMGNALLFVEEDGFAILQEGRDPWTAEPHVFVWILWFKPNTAKARRDELVRMAA
jgi:hypothetical protein